MSEEYIEEGINGQWTDWKFEAENYKKICEHLQQENKQLKDKINTYENPEDLTLMFMYCDEKAKDKIKQLKEVIEEVREYIIDCSSREITLDIAEIYEKRGIEWIN